MQFTPGLSSHLTPKCAVLQSANVLLKSTTTDPRGFLCKLADFGLSRVLDMDATHISTKTYGTISYMPAELLSQGKLTRSADVYSFAMLSECAVACCHPSTALFQACTMRRQSPAMCAQLCCAQPISIRVPVVKTPVPSR